MVVLTIESYIRHMPHRAFVRLSTFLDPGGLWEKMAARIPMKLEEVDNENAERRYSHQNVAVYAYMGQRAGSGNSPTQKVLMDWGTKNARIHHLIKVLLQVELLAAADYLHNDLLQLGPIPRPPSTTPSSTATTATPTDPKGRPLAENNCDTENDRVADLQDEVHQRKTSATEQKGEWALSGLSEMSDELKTISDHMSHFSSPRVSVLDEGGGPLSLLQREQSVDSEDRTEAWIGLSDIQIQTIQYTMLGLITNSFNEDPLEKGGNLIGSGGFGMVYQGQFHNGFKVAVKVLKQGNQLKREDLIKQFENEVKTLSTYRHDNVVHLLGYSIDGPSQCLVYQYLPNGSLEDRLARLQGRPPLSANMRLKVVKGTAHGIQYLNDSGYVHRDIKTANILLDSQFTAKVGDFATVVSAPSGDGQTIAHATSVIGTLAYLAPEALRFDVSTKLDAYSFGVVLLEVITGLAAQDSGREEATLTSHIMENVEDPGEIHDYVDPTAGAWQDGVVDTLYDVAMRCLTISKKRRPNVKDIRPELDAL